MKKTKLAAAGPGIEHVFVLMLENRSFDHMLGFSGITGTDAVTGAATAIQGLSGAESNHFNGQEYKVAAGADYVASVDPGHEFGDVLQQLCGPAATYPSGGDYPASDCSGYAASFATGGAGRDPGQVMKCYKPDQLPVLNALAREFAVCDNWYAPMPGPTWPNRMFVHAASSGGLDHSPTTAEIVRWEVLSGFALPHGSIFDRLKQRGIRRSIYGGDDFPMIAALKGIKLGDVRPYRLFAGDVAQGNFSGQYTFIEPSYDVLNDYKNGTSQHPLGDVRPGEALIKATYEAIRNSPIWKSSLLIITWDEHGGFFDHVPPPKATAPGDTAAGNKNSKNGFTFRQYGPRVPAVVISPRIPKNLVDHRVYDHSSIPATVEAVFGIEPMTARDRGANGLGALVSLATAREDTPATLPAPASAPAAMHALQAPAADIAAAPASRPGDSVNEGNLPAILQSAMQQEIQVAPEEREAITARVAAIRTRSEAREYLAHVQARVRPAKQRAVGL